MKIKNLTAELVHEADFVSINFQVPVADFISFVDNLKKNRPVKLKAAPVVVDLHQKRQTFYKSVKSFQLLNPKKYPSGLYLEFTKYWTEPSKNGKTIRYDEVKYFDLGRRLSTWKSKTDKNILIKWWEEEEKVLNLF